MTKIKFSGAVGPKDVPCTGLPSFPALKMP